MKNVENLAVNTYVQVVGLRGHKGELNMAVIRTLYKILPEKAGSEVIDSIVNEIRKRSREGMFKLIDYKREPVAFGLYSLLILIEFEEKEGILSKVESLLSSIEGVQSINVIRMSRF